MFMDADTRGTEFLFYRQVFYMFLNSGICDEFAFAFARLSEAR